MSPHALIFEWLKQPDCATGEDAIKLDSEGVQVADGHLVNGDTRRICMLSPIMSGREKNNINNVSFGVI